MENLKFVLIERDNADQILNVKGIKITANNVIKEVEYKNGIKI